MARGDDLKKRVGKLWQDAVAQIEGVAGNARAQLEKEVTRLKGERDKLLVRLGEQTLTWVNKSPVKVPTVIQGTVDKLNDLVEGMKPKKAAPAPKAAAAKPAKKAAAPKKKTAPKAKATPKKSAANKAPVSRKKLEV